MIERYRIKGKAKAWAALAYHYAVLGDKPRALYCLRRAEKASR